ncbi:hypothetical protein [uncultured Clostridium sp.]|uniref:hypothetical protein n=1 Tax=uncultured Clostridium sp. TaxID=59620 RepID=UPI0028F005FF|nr:hypothetical protein [uncultured Clostridium sp.]
MATKLYNKHLSDIMNSSKSYYILDTYIAMAYMSVQVENKFYIQTYSENISNLVRLVMRYVKDVSYGAIRNAITELIDLDILFYDKEMDFYVLNEMENMLKKKNFHLSEDKTEKLVGYTNIQDIFLTPRFSKMKFREKRLLIYIFQLADSNANKNYGINNVCNLLKINSSWMKILRTKCLYYAEDTIRKFLLNNTDIFEDTSDKFRIEFAPKHVNRFRFSFNLKKENVSKNGLDTDRDLRIIINNNQSEYSYIVSKCLFVDVVLTNTQLMHIMRAVIPLPIWSYKVELIDSIINKLKLSEDEDYDGKISSLPAYLFGITRRLMEEHRNYLSSKAEIITQFESAEAKN